MKSNKNVLSLYICLSVHVIFRNAMYELNNHKNNGFPIKFLNGLFNTFISNAARIVANKRAIMSTSDHQQFLLLVCHIHLFAESRTKSSDSRMGENVSRLFTVSEVLVRL